MTAESTLPEIGDQTFARLYELVGLDGEHVVPRAGSLRA
jgi:hypothetical protein